MVDAEDSPEQQLHDKDWLKRAVAVRHLSLDRDAAVRCLPTVFELTFDEKEPVRAVSETLIRRLGTAAVAFLLDRSSSHDANHRRRSLNLLAETGCAWRTTVSVAEQILPPRTTPLPDWGSDADSVMDRFVQSLADPDLGVRFAAASALEEFGRFSDGMIATFVEILEKGKPREQNWAALHLGRIGPAAHVARDAIVKAAQSIDKDVRLAAKKALARIGE